MATQYHVQAAPDVEALVVPQGVATSLTLRDKDLVGSSIGADTVIYGTVDELRNLGERIVTACD